MRCRPFIASIVTALSLTLVTTALAVAREALPVQTVAFESPSVGRTMKYNIVLPTDYESSGKRYPVLYLLHGLTSNYTAWAKMNVPLFAAKYDLIVVMPDVGNTWYVNWAECEDGHKHNWEDAIIKDLIGHVDSTYRTIASREGRGINGLSMGGYGALMLGLRHPDMFCTVGSHSGALRHARTIADSIRAGEGMPEYMRREQPTKINELIQIEGFSSPADRTPKGKIFATVEECDAHDPYKLVLNIPKDQLPHLCIDCGTSDRLLEGSQEFAELLMKNQIPFTYAESPGGHVPPYWAREVGHSMAIQYLIIERSLAVAEKARAQEAANAAAAATATTGDGT